MQKMLLCVAMLGLSACATGQLESNSGDASANSVKVTNMAQNHGGTGIILESSPDNSTILTNSHVCGVVEEGGIVAGQAGSFMVTSYKKSLNHDLCLIRVSGDLKGGATLAERPPVPFYEKATISGHPSLYPNVKTYGHFSGRQPVPIIVGIKPCTEADAQDTKKAFMCLILGGAPIIKIFDAVLVTATIMPGSSGSGVYNEDMELSGVVFAGSGDLGYAWTVPYEYVRDFLTKEADTLPESKPTNDLDVFGDNKEKSEENKLMQKLQSVCDSSDRAKIKNICDIVQSTIIK